MSLACSNRWILRTVYRYFWAYPFLFLDLLFSHLLVAGSVRYVSYWVHVKITSRIISYRVARWRHASVEVHLSEQANDVLNRARLGDSAKGMHFRHVNGSVVGWGFRSAWGQSLLHIHSTLRTSTIRLNKATNACDILHCISASWSK